MKIANRKVNYIKFHIFRFFFIFFVKLSLKIIKIKTYLRKTAHKHNETVKIDEKLGPTL